MAEADLQAPAGWSFTPGVTVAGGFDSNVALASAPADTRRTQSDGLFIAEPFAQLEFVSPRTEFSSGYQSYVRRYVDIEELNGFDHRAYVRHTPSARARPSWALRLPVTHAPVHRAPGRAHEEAVRAALDQGPRREPRRDRRAGRPGLP